MQYFLVLHCFKPNRYRWFSCPLEFRQADVCSRGYLFWVDDMVHGVVLSTEAVKVRLTVIWGLNFVLLCMQDSCQSYVPERCARYSDMRKPQLAMK